MRRIEEELDTADLFALMGSPAPASTTSSGGRRRRSHSRATQNGGIPLAATLPGTSSSKSPAKVSPQFRG